MSRAKASSSAPPEPAANSGAAAKRRKAAVRHLPCDLSGLDGLQAGSLGLFCYADERPLAGVAALVDWRVCGAVSQAIVTGLFEGRQGEHLMVPVSGRFGPRRLFVFGLGPAAAYGADVARQVCADACRVLRQAGATSSALAAPARAGHVAVEAAFVRLVQEEFVGQIDQVLSEKV